MIKVSMFTIRSLMILFWFVLVLLFFNIPRLGIRLHDRPTLSILTWTNTVAPQVLDDFEKKTGVKVYLNYFESNEELLAKLRFSGGKGFDLILPSDHMVYTLHELGLLKKIDRSKITMWDQIKPQLLGQYFDPNNNYSIPYMWDIYGVGVNKTFFDGTLPPASWDLIFNKQKAIKKVGMLNDPREVILIAARYFLGHSDDISQDDLEKVTALLCKHKPMVEAYSDLRADYLLASGTSAVAMAPTSAMVWALRTNKNLGFVVPKDSFILVDSLVMPAATKNDALVYQLINFLLDANVAYQHFNDYGILPSNVHALERIDFADLGLDSINWAGFNYFKPTVSNEQLHQAWRAVKAC